MASRMTAPAFAGWERGIAARYLRTKRKNGGVALISLISINDLHRRVARYREMCAVLQAARKQIAYGRTWSSLERVVQQTERALLQEVIEWHSITSFAESH